GEYGRIGRYAVAFGKDHQVAPDDVDAGNAFLDAVADHKRPRAGQIAQTFEHALGAGFLNDGNEDRGAGKKPEHDSLFEIAENKVDRRRAQQQREHRLAEDLEDDTDEGAAGGGGGGGVGLPPAAGGGGLLPA